jgi:amino acid transporter
MGYVIIFGLAILLTFLISLMSVSSIEAYSSYHNHFLYYRKICVVVISAICIFHIIVELLGFSPANRILFTVKDIIVFFTPFIPAFLIYKISKKIGEAELKRRVKVIALINLSIAIAFYLIGIFLFANSDM